jgi:hypothetical protein
MRGLLAAMNEWIKNGAEPPASQIPLLAKGELVSLKALKFPAIAPVPKRHQMAWRADYGPEFRSHGIVTHEPPKLGNAFPTLVPQVDADGNETSGLRLPEIQVPLGTYTGWNLRDASIGSPEEIFNMVGSFFAFARTKAEREQKRDPRPSIEERYASREAYLSKVTDAAKTLVTQRYILAQDIPLLEQHAVKQWDALAR